jgi:hypothetical protein
MRFATYKEICNVQRDLQKPSLVFQEIQDLDGLLENVKLLIHLYLLGSYRLLDVLFV